MTKKYPIIKQYILDKINSGEYIADKMLPAENFFTNKFNVSRMTVRRSLDELIQEGVLIRKSGSGVYLSKKKITRAKNKTSVSRDKDIISLYDKLSTKVIEFKTITKHHALKKYLNIDDEEVYEVKRIQYGDNKPIVLEVFFLPKKYFPNLNKELFNQSMQLIESDYSNLKDTTHKISVEAVVATKQLSSLLDISISSAILKMNAVVYQDDIPVYLGINYYPGDEFVYIN